MSPSEDDVRLAKKIVDAYRASGLGAKMYRGLPFVHREGGWEGPLDPHELEKTYRDEIRAIEQTVRQASIRCWEQFILETSEVSGRFGFAGPSNEIDQDTFGLLILGPIRFASSGLGESQSRIYASVAHCLQIRGELWT